MFFRIKLFITRSKITFSLFIMLDHVTNPDSHSKFYIKIVLKHTDAQNLQQAHFFGQKEVVSTLSFSCLDTHTATRNRTQMGEYPGTAPEDSRVAERPPSALEPERLPTSHMTTRRQNYPIMLEKKLTTLYLKILSISFNN